MRKLIATLALAFAGVGIAAHAIAPDGAGDDALYPRSSTLQILQRSARL